MSRSNNDDYDNNDTTTNNNNNDNNSNNNSKNDKDNVNTTQVESFDQSKRLRSVYGNAKFERPDIC